MRLLDSSYLAVAELEENLHQLFACIAGKVGGTESEISAQAPRPDDFLTVPAEDHREIVPGVLHLQESGHRFRLYSMPWLRSG